MKGIIIKSLSGEYDVYLENKEIIKCKPLGLFRHKNIRPKVGDNVIVQDAQIIEIEKRTSELVRPDVCNVNSAIIVTSLVEPELNLNLLDKILISVEYNNIDPVLVFTKADLVKSLEDFEKVIDYYKSLGYKCFILPFEKDELKLEFEGKISVLVGQSGVGKSTLLNLIANLDLKTDKISYALGRGKHTTRHTELIEVCGGFIADTPGFGALDLEMDKQTLSQNFREFFKCKCKYNPCLHLNEPFCEVKEKVKNGLILKSRYDNYLSFIQEIDKKLNYYRRVK